MKLNLKTALTGSAATIALLAASSANASGYYLGVFGGWSTMEDSFNVGFSTSGFDATATFTQTDTGYTGTGSTSHFFSTAFTLKYTAASRTSAITTNNSFDDGWVVGAALGWDFGNGWRTELEAAYRSHDLNSTGSLAGTRYYSYYFTRFYSYTANHLTGTGTTTSTLGFTTWTNTVTANNFGAKGDLETWSFMFNLWHDFDFGDSPLHPFVGGGIGFAHATLSYDITQNVPLGTNPALFGTQVSYRGNGEATDWGFAYQVGAGLGYDLGNGMTLSAQYRYFNTGAMDLSLADQIEVNLESHNFLIGVNIPLGGGM
jgi:opacity protein-like surface antigen